MRVSDLAKQLNTTSETILAKLKALKLKAKDSDQELNAVVVSVLRNEFSKDKKAAPTAEPAKPAKPAEAKKETKEIKEPVKVSDKETKPKIKAAAATKEKTPKVSKKKEEPPKVVSKEEKIAKPRKSTAQPIAESKPAPAVVEKAPPVQKVELPVKKPVVTPPPVEVYTKPKHRISDEPFEPVKPLLKKKKKPGQPVPGNILGGHKPGLDRIEGSQSSNVIPSAGGVSVLEPQAAGKDKMAQPALASSAPVAEAPPLQTLELKMPISVKDLAVKLQQKLNVVLKKLLDMGIFVTINQHLTEEIVKNVAASFGYKIAKVKSQEEQLIETHKTEEDDPKSLKPRAPVVTFMGHVDHGKTSLLDRIRKTKVADQEHGGITQHIGAYSVRQPKGIITFLDTPGHEAFTAMRARGAHITDLVVLVIAADEGIMPQTIEAMNHARAANVPIIVALNKIDKPNADVDRVKKQLSEHDLLPEDWGGKTIVVGVSAATGQGIDQLLEMILLESELLELKANYEKRASGIVIEAHMSHGRGAIASVIVQNGTLKEGDMIVVGPYFGTVRAMFDDHERPIKQAGPSIAAEILGLPAVPDAGEMFYVIETEKQAREIASVRQEQLKAQKMEANAAKISLEDLYAQIKEGKIKELSVIVKADVQGSMEALVDSLRKIPSDEVQVRFIHMGIGAINASDIILADVSNAIIIGFQVDVDSRGKQELEKHPVEIRTYRIIYDAVNDIRNALEGLLEPKTRKKFVGRADVRQVFKVSKAGIVAGSHVSKGKIHRKVNMDVVRNGEVVFSGVIGSLKRFKDDVREVTEGMECGIGVKGFDEVQIGDVLEAYELEKIARKL